MCQVAIGWQVYEVRGNPLDLGLVGLAEFLPLPLLALPAGHIADRLPRRSIFAVATVIDLVVVAGLLVVTIRGASVAVAVLRARLRHGHRERRSARRPRVR